MEKGDVIGEKYRADFVLSKRGHRQRWIGQRISDNERVIIETLHDTMTGDHSAVEGIRYEIELSTKLTNPCFMSCIDTLTDHSKIYLVWKYVDAETVTKSNSLTRLSERELCTLISSIVAGLTFAHAQGVVHGAISTDAILVTPSLEPIITGFSMPGASPTTDPGMTVGVGPYQACAPELLRGEPIDASCDFYAVGIIARYLFDNSTTIKSDSRSTEKHARQLIAQLCSSDRSLRVIAAERIMDPTFLDDMITPAQGMETVSISRSKSRKIRNQYHRRTKAPIVQNDATKMYIATAIRAIIIIVIALFMLYLLVQITK